MLAKITRQPGIFLVAMLRVVIATICTVAGLVGIAYLAKMLGAGKALIITSSVIVGVCGFFIGIYWTVNYLVKSGIGKNNQT